MKMRTLGKAPQNGKGRGPEKGRSLPAFRAGFDEIDWRRKPAGMFEAEMKTTNRPAPRKIKASTPTPNCGSAKGCQDMRDIAGRPGPRPMNSNMPNLNLPNAYLASTNTAAVQRRHELT
jgi:hypothetical protein